LTRLYESSDHARIELIDEVDALRKEIDSVRKQIANDNDQIRVLRELVETQKQALQESASIDQVQNINIFLIIIFRKIRNPSPNLKPIIKNFTKNLKLILHTKTILH
jgi:predicted nucleic acid-binding protein